jgi:hypothetical protein
LDKGTPEANAGIEEPVLELVYYFPCFGGRMEQVLAEGVPSVDKDLARQNQAEL